MVTQSLGTAVRTLLWVTCCALLSPSVHGQASDRLHGEVPTDLIADSSASWSDPVFVRVTDGTDDGVAVDADAINEPLLVFDRKVENAQFQDRILPLPTITPQIARATSAPSPVSGATRLVGFNSVALNIGVASYVRGLEGKPRQSTDIGSLLGKSPSALGVRAVRRSPIVTDNKVRGKKNGQLLASGSYWFPARMDLDTVMSKIDSRNLEDVIVVRGPYSSVYGPGFNFIDFELQSTPRYAQFQAHGSTSFDYQTNGEQFHGRQTVSGGDSDSGFLFSYGHRTGNDYESGDGTGIPSSYKSRDIMFSYGVNLSDASRLEVTLLRLDQTDVEMPGQAFDIDYLVSDAVEIELESNLSSIADRHEASVWYNRTDLAGDAQRAGKRRQFPFYDQIDFAGETDVDSMSAGYSTSWTWETGNATVTAGTDLRHLKQEVNEFTDGELGLNFWQNRNSPIPRSHHSNPGLFVQRTLTLSPALTLTSGGRIDFVSANIDDDPARLVDLGIRTPFDPQMSLSHILGTDDFDRDFMLGSTFLLAELKTAPNWKATLGYGYAERAPTMTELYAAQTFMFLMQNGLNTVTGDPNLEKERMWQIDAGLSYNDGRLRGGLHGFHSWIRDYITFENLRTFDVEQVNLKFVNTHLATLAGGEFYAEYDSSPWVTSFATVSYVEGRDHSRDGDFATIRTEPGVPSQQVTGLERGAFGTAGGAEEEPLPNISPLHARLGIRLHQAGRNPNWSVELSSRIVDNQDRVATSLRESATPGFAVWDLRTFWRPSSAVLFVAGVENFTDKQYREYMDFRPQGNGALAVYQPGVNFYFGSELTY